MDCPPALWPKIVIYAKQSAQFYRYSVRWSWLACPARFLPPWCIEYPPTCSGSPPKASTFALIHAIDRRWSRMPKFPWKSFGPCPVARKPNAPTYVRAPVASSLRRQTYQDDIGWTPRWHWCYLRNALGSKQVGTRPIAGSSHRW